QAGGWWECRTREGSLQRVGKRKRSDDVGVTVYPVSPSPTTRTFVRMENQNDRDAIIDTFRRAGLELLRPETIHPTDATPFFHPHLRGSGGAGVFARASLRCRDD